MTEKELSLLEDEMHRLIRSETPIRKVTIFSEDAKAYYHQRYEHQEAELLEASGKSTVDFYEIDKNRRSLPRKPRKQLPFHLPIRLSCI